MDYKTILTNYILAANATKGQIVYQPCDGMLEVCESEETKRELLTLVNDSDITLHKSAEESAYQELVNWSKESDLLLESSEGVLFCIPKQAA